MEYKYKIVRSAFGGSVSYGLNTPESDVDLAQVVVCEPSYYLGLPTSKQLKHQTIEKSVDRKIWEIQHFASLIAKATPSAVEFLYSKPLEYLPRFGDLFKAFREESNCHLFYRNFANMAFGIVQSECDYESDRDAKRLSHIIRIVHQIQRFPGKNWLDCSAIREEVLSFRREMSPNDRFNFIKEKIEILKNWESDFCWTSKQNPDREKLNQILTELLKRELNGWQIGEPQQ